MPRFQKLVGELNEVFRETRVQELAERSADFAPGKPLDEALADLVAKRRTALHRTFKAYLAKLPGSISETVRSTIHYALQTDPPILITFAWAPAYDYEVTVWQSPDTKETRGGITMLLKSRYPSDRHPIS